MAERREAARWTSAANRIEATVEARVVSRAERSGALQVVLGELRRTDRGTEPVPERARLRVEAGVRSPLADCVVGDRVRARVRLRPLVSRFDPGSADPAERLRRAGIAASGSLADPALAVRLERGWRLRASGRGQRAAPGGGGRAGGPGRRPRRRPRVRCARRARAGRRGRAARRRADASPGGVGPQPRDGGGARLRGGAAPAAAPRAARPGGSAPRSAGGGVGRVPGLRRAHRLRGLGATRAGVPQRGLRGARAAARAGARAA